MSQFIRPAAQALGPIIGKPAPHFKAMSWCSPTQAFKEVSLEDYKNKYLLLFFYPLDFTFVCPTEIIEFSNKTKQFKEIGCEILGCSIDSQHTHRQWTLKDRKDGGIGKIEYPLLADTNHQIAHNYGVLTEKGIALRGSFIIDDEQILRHISINDLGVGRNVEEYLRLVKAFQFNKKNGEVCPASWRPGERAMTPDVNSDKLKSYWTEVHATKK